MIIELDKRDRIFIIKSKICLICGKGFSKAKKKKELFKSDHHAIPQKMKPLFKVVIPIHVKCHMELNKNFLPKSEIIKLEKKVESIYNNILRFKNGKSIKKHQ